VLVSLSLSFDQEASSDVYFLLAPSPSAPSAKIVKGILRSLSLKRQRVRGGFLCFVCCICLILSSSRRVPSVTPSTTRTTPCVNLPLCFCCYTYAIAGVRRKLRRIGLLIQMTMVILSKFLLFWPLTSLLIYLVWSGCLRVRKRIG
jgi:hypothetical protein